MNLTDPALPGRQDKAREWLEAQRWPNGPYCPHCGNSDQDKITASLKARRIVPACTSAMNAVSSSP